MLTETSWCSDRLNDTKANSKTADVTRLVVVQLLRIFASGSNLSL